MLSYIDPPHRFPYLFALFRYSARFSANEVKIMKIFIIGIGLEYMALLFDCPLLCFGWLSVCMNANISSIKAAGDKKLGIRVSVYCRKITRVSS